MTLHRPNNVDDERVFEGILEALEEIQKRIKIIYPAHPRTQKRIKEFGLVEKFRFLTRNSSFITHNSFLKIDPLRYLDFLKLMSESKFVLTDSGGIQEETTILGIPCVTLRENTERPITGKEGTNVVVGSDKEKIVNESFKIVKGNKKQGRIPKFWEGKVGERIVDILLEKN